MTTDAPAASQTVDVFIAPDGDDAAPGTVDLPVASLGRALERVATAEIQSADDSRIICSVEAHAEGVLIGCGTNIRARVHRERFVEGLGIS